LEEVFQIASDMLEGSDKYLSALNKVY